MSASGSGPAPGALEQVRRLAGPAAAIAAVTRLEGGQHADSWWVDTAGPARSIVVREFPPEDDAAWCEQRVLRALGGLGGLAPLPLGCAPGGRWSPRPTSLISWLDGEPDIVPADPSRWAAELGRALAAVHAVSGDEPAELPDLLDTPGGSRELLAGPLAAEVRARWAEIAAAPRVLSHGDFWSGNVVWRAGRLSGVVDWSGAARGPRGFDLGWCRLDLVLLSGGDLADEFTSAYEAESGGAPGDLRLWDCWAAARSHDGVASWAPNYAPLGRPDLEEAELRRRHAAWAERLRESGRERHA